MRMNMIDKVQGLKNAEMVFSLLEEMLASRIDYEKSMIKRYRDGSETYGYITPYNDGDVQGLTLSIDIAKKPGHNTHPRVYTVTESKGSDTIELAGYMHGGKLPTVRDEMTNGDEADVMRFPFGEYVKAAKVLFNWAKYDHQLKLYRED